jgi:hypothetical protein
MRATTKHKPLYCASLGAIAAILLVTASLVVPTSTAYADRENSSGKPQDDQNSHEKTIKGDDPKEPKRCENFAPEKYNKHCED